LPSIEAAQPDAQKKTITATERDREDVIARREEFLREVAQLDAKDLVFMDEAGSHVAMTRDRARSPKGERAHGKVPRNRGVVTTILGALTLAGLSAVMTVEGATSGNVFTAYVKRVLAPTLRPGNVVVLDNLGAHKVPEAREAIEAAGARLLFLPPYSPDLNPIEETWSKVKGHLRSQEPRTIEDLDRSVADAAERVTPSDAAGWIQHAGYQLTR
jgi:transposase